MPKRPTRQAAEPNEQPKKTTAGEQAKKAWTGTLKMIKSEQFHFVAGFFIAAFALYCFVTYLSFLFVGFRDMAEIGTEGNPSDIVNFGGSFGAHLQELFINRLFGLSALSLIVMLMIHSLGLMKALKVSYWKSFFHCAFWLIWVSWVLGFFQQITGWATFIHWGGGHGNWFYTMLEPSLHWFGILLILIVCVVTYFVIISPNTIPNLQRFALWIKNLFTKKKKEEPLAEETTENAPEEVPVVIDLNTEDEGDDLTVVEPGNSATDDGAIDLTDLTDEPASEDSKNDDGLELTFAETPDEETLTEEAHADEPADETEPADDETPEDKPDDEDIDLTIHGGQPNAMVTKTPEQLLAELGPYDPRKDLENYKFPSLDLLKVYDNENAPIIDQDEQRANANRIVTTLRNYGVEIESIKATVGPTVTLYEVVPKAGVRITKIQSLEADIMLSLSAVGIRIIAPMPGKGTVGIEVPNEKPQTVSMHSVIASKRFQEEKKMRLPIALGRTITNEIFMFDLAKTPHLLVAGATGQGKSVAINAIITSLLYKKHPAEMKMVLVDPKMVEFAPYKPLIRHYLAAQPDTEDKDVIITDCSKVIDTLNSLVIEMENRYTLLMDAGVRNLEDYNDKFVARRLNPDKLVNDKLHHQYLPYIVIVIDEYGDFIMQAGKQVEQPIARITQKARAVGMHMILATQRPSVNIVTGVIKANIPTRIALRTQSVVDSRTVLDAKGADQLIGRGDLLYSGSGNITRVQCAFVDTPEVDAIVEHVEKQQHYFAPYELPEYVGGEGGEGEALAPGSVDLKKLDPMFAEVARYVVLNQQGSTSILQRKFEIGYNRAGKLSDQLEAAGVVGPAKGSKGRDVLIQDEMGLNEVFTRLGLM